MRLEDALQKIEHPVNVTYRSFELDPSMERTVNQTIYEKLAAKYGMSLEQARVNCQNMVNMAREVGLDFRFDEMILTNTFDAHRLVMFAKTKGLMHEMTDRILRAYYTESKHIGDHATLADLADDIGLDREPVVEMLASNEMSEMVHADEQKATEYGIQSIPFFLLNGKYALTGAQPTDVFVKAMEQIIEQDGRLEEDGLKDGANCDDTGCAPPKKL
jgi:predicted DsbA family dithiol-disulfide isomerase